MIEINLAPGANRRRGAARKRALPSLPSLPTAGIDSRSAGIGAIALVLLFAIGFTFWRLSARQAELERALQAEVADSARYATTIELVQTLRARQDTIRQQIEVIREVDQRRYVWPHLLDEISAAIPPFTWLTEIQATQPADTLAQPLAFTIEGNAGSTQSLTRLMKNLEASSFIRTVTLITSEQEEIEGRSVHRFTLEATYQEPDSSVIETVPIIAVE